jgi:hypothetical protein
MFKIVLLVLIIAFASSLNFFNAPKKNVPKTLGPAAAKGKPEPPAPKKPVMTWGGRPDPTPEIYVDETAKAVLPGWKFNLFGKKK